MKNTMMNYLERTRRTILRVACVTAMIGTLGVGTAYAAVTLEGAKSVALADAGVAESEVVFTEVKEKQEKKEAAKYEIEFYTDEAEYEYEIRKSDGAILEVKMELFHGERSQQRSANSTSGTYISVDDAKEIVLKRAGLSESEVRFKKAKLDKDDGIMVYEIEFYHGRNEYECTVDASTGKIIEYDVEIDD
ncbi:MAG: PepSY domain-containing protein [Clostridiales bacterium]|nr:PepSY domain-containing protein [Clostridiales bacterium]